MKFYILDQGSGLRFKTNTDCFIHTHKHTYVQTFIYCLKSGGSLVCGLTLYLRINAGFWVKSNIEKIETAMKLAKLEAIIVP